MTHCSGDEPERHRGGQRRSILAGLRQPEKTVQRASTLTRYLFGLPAKRIAAIERAVVLVWKL